MNKDVIRLGFSFLSATVTLTMSQEWFTWAVEQNQAWKTIPGTVLAPFAVFEAHQVWPHVGRILEL